MVGEIGHHVPVELAQGIVQVFDGLTQFFFIPGNEGHICAKQCEFNGGCELSVSFKLPIYMPSWLMLQRWPIENGSMFALRDGQGEKPHLSGTLKSLR